MKIVGFYHAAAHLLFLTIASTGTCKCSPSCTPSALRLRSHRNIWYTIYGIRYTLFGIRNTLYGHGGSHRSSTSFQCALFVSMKKLRIRYFEKIFAFTSRGGGEGGNT